MLFRVARYVSHLCRPGKEFLLCNTQQNKLKVRRFILITYSQNHKFICIHNYLCGFRFFWDTLNCCRFIHADDKSWYAELQYCPIVLHGLAFLPFSRRHIPRQEHKVIPHRQYQSFLPCFRQKKINQVRDITDKCN